MKLCPQYPYCDGSGVCYDCHLELDAHWEAEHEAAQAEQCRIMENERHWEAEARRAFAQPTPGYTPAVRRVEAQDRKHGGGS